MVNNVESYGVIWNRWVEHVDLFMFNIFLGGFIWIKLFFLLDELVFSPRVTIVLFWV